MAFKELTYAEKLRLPAWQRKRLEIMQRDGFRCQSCKSDRITLNVHHKDYIKGREPWDYPNDNFQTLCEPCHSKSHSLIQEEKPIDDACFLPLKVRQDAGKMSIHRQIQALQESLKTIDPSSPVMEETLTKIMKLQKELRD